MAKDAVIMGRSLNRAVYDENGSLRAILAGNLMVVRRNGKTTRVYVMINASVQNRHILLKMLICVIMCVSSEPCDEK